jgi:plasmid stabilization system protein ParE
MSQPVVLRPAAIADINFIYDELQQILPGLGEKFSDRLQEVLEHIERNPNLYGVVYRDVHAVRLRRFQYVLYYVVRDNRTDVLAVIHGARRESSWRSRVE